MKYLLFSALLIMSLSASAQLHLTTTAPVIVNNPSHSIGESFGGGIVFWVNTEGSHGLIAETRDIDKQVGWYTAQDYISVNSNHSITGKLYTDWRLPTRNELTLIYAQRTLLGVFTNYYYWSSTESDAGHSWALNFQDGTQNPGAVKGLSCYVRAVRSF